MNRLLGAFTNLEKSEKLKLVNTIMQTYLWSQNQGDELTDIDRVNLDDIIIVAIEILQEIKIYEQSVLSPINFIKISILEYALKRSPNNNNLRIWLMKIEDKMGLSSKFTGVSS
jgi:hypothetical protein